jgi:hypothetical protein
MGYEKITDLSCDTVVKLGGVDEKTGKKNPTTMEGYYLGARKVQSSNGESVIHVFQTAKGNMGIWGSADTNTKLGSAKLGRMTLVEFQGKVKIGGGKTKNRFDVSQDPDLNIAVSTPPTSASASSNSNDGDYESNYSDDDSGYEASETLEDETEEEEEAPAPAAKAKPPVNAKIQDILNRGKTKSA